MLLQRLIKALGLYPLAQWVVTVPRHSRLYPRIRRWRDRRALREWRAGDAARLAFYSQLISPNDLVFDVGANVGNRTKVFLRLGARVVAFEPQSSCASLLQQELGTHPRFRLVRKALGDKIGTAELRLGTAHVLATMSESWMHATQETGRFGSESWQGREQILVTTLDEVIREFGAPSFAKIDVEGYEPQVLSGLSQPLRSGSVEFAVEAFDGILWCMERLCSLHAYEFQFSARETMRFAWAQWFGLVQARNALAKLTQEDEYAWGDLYFRISEPVAATA
jgi:FkbM family methyltransferase